jgi:hypothetical protein
MSIDLEVTADAARAGTVRASGSGRGGARSTLVGLAAHGALNTAFPTQYFITSESRVLAPHNLNSPNRRMRTRMSGGLGGE